MNFLSYETDFSSHADDNTFYRIAGITYEIIKLIERDSIMLFKRFYDNQMKKKIKKISKCHLLVNQKNEVVINLGETEIKNSEYEKLTNQS